MSRKRCTSALVMGAIIFLCSVVIFIWIQFSQGSFGRNNYHQPLAEPSGNATQNLLERTTSRTIIFKIKEDVADIQQKERKTEKTHLDDLGIHEAELVKPLKINPDDENQHFIEGNKTSLKHHSGNFRPANAEIWDPHPKYKINAFGKELILELKNNYKFLGPNIHIISHGNNYSRGFPHDPKLSGCFYTGELRNDGNSAIAVDLCNGMTGYIRSSEANYFIEPAENFTNINTLGIIQHRIKMLPHSNNDETNDILQESIGDWNRNQTGTIIEDDFPEEVISGDEHRTKRFASYAEDDVVYEYIQQENLTLDELRRSGRETDWTNNSSSSSSSSSSAIKDSSIQYYVKVLVVADETMLKYHGNEAELYKYILILMSHVTLLFKEASIGNPISISVVHIRILQDPIPDVANSSSIDMLRKFCQWKNVHFSQDYSHDFPRQKHDVALLLTRNLICKSVTDSKTCTTLGVAEIDSMCKSSGCAIVRDKGLSTSYSIAHEFGHALGMIHDEEDKCILHNQGSLNTNNIMSRTTKKHSKPFMWSPCSNQFATDFLDSTKSKCLYQPPEYNQIPLSYNKMLPGDLFEVDRQCELEFGPGRTRCLIAIDSPPCLYLWCKSDEDECISHSSPWAEGTKCGPYSWCYKRQCISQDPRVFVPIHGGWGEFQQWGSCSRTCGGGIQKSIRYCDSPIPENGGNYCIGKSIKYKSCNTQNCNKNTRDFREEQCSRYNGVTKGLPNLTVDVKWIPKYGLGSAELPDDYCRLYCKPKPWTAYYPLKEKVEDGTKCGNNYLGICVNGICRPGGCDNELDSVATFDKCGICGGTNNTCKEIIGNYNKRATQVSYNEVVRIPRDSSSLEIKQFSYEEDQNYLALRDGETGEYILNGNQRLEANQIQIEYHSVIIKYSGTYAQPEWISTMNTEKLTRDLIVEVFSIENLPPPNINYKYIIPLNFSYGWQFSKSSWSKCTSVCDGIQYRTPVCVHLITGEKVRYTYCDTKRKESATQRKSCNTHCSLTWQIKSKSICSSRCGKGYRQVNYKCVKAHKLNAFDEEIEEKHCSPLEKPPTHEECNINCDYLTRWEYSTWSECSTSCGEGFQRRAAKCVDENNFPIDDHHCSTSLKITEQICNLQKNCFQWIITGTSECSTLCGGGYQNVNVSCVLDNTIIIDSNNCDQNSKPAIIVPCNEHECGDWIPTNSFHPCSVSCGNGVEKRRYECKKYNGEILPEEYCRNSKIPRDDSRSCNIECEKPLNFPLVSSQRNVNDPFANYHWKADSWSECSQSCNGGVKTQNFFCVNKNGQEVSFWKCKNFPKPENLSKCNEQTCPYWRISDWSPKCDEKCERHRQVRCLNNKLNFFDDSACNIETKPTSTKKCSSSECHVYKWKIGPWKKCSTDCGKGTKLRNVDCIDMKNSIFVVDGHCSHHKKPKTSKSCERYQCKYVWQEEPWSDCSASCGLGTQKRDVKCYKVYPEGIDRTPLPNLRHYPHKADFCNNEKKPSSIRRCEISNCRDQFIWKTEQWKPCSYPCGKKGRQNRMVYCININTKEKVSKNLCPKVFKPPTKRKCNQFRCSYKNCKEIKTFMKTTKNNDYIINLMSRNVKIYCYKMDTPEPEEFISLDPDKENYSEFYDKRLLDISSCPYGGERYDNCNCDRLALDRTGITKFWKVRLNINAMEIIGDDFTFSNHTDKTRISYGTAGDCYSNFTSGCPQGRFIIDLTGTSFKLSKEVQWKIIGPYSFQKIQASNDGRKVNGKCGGYCGQCSPDPNYGGLKVEIT